MGLSASCLILPGEGKCWKSWRRDPTQHCEGTPPCVFKTGAISPHVALMFSNLKYYLSIWSHGFCVIPITLAFRHHEPSTGHGVLSFTRALPRVGLRAWDVYHRRGACRSRYGPGLGSLESLVMSNNTYPGDNTEPETIDPRRLAANVHDYYDMSVLQRQTMLPDRSAVNIDIPIRDTTISQPSHPITRSSYHAEGINSDCPHTEYSETSSQPLALMGSQVTPL
ncbi:hypothetical protein B0T25DRAFT_138358 [Lasiosphaeria hispida]|uniref:Uncharacterized protein n=1 Tax=Lasiosphaeria hispida TaxID=260671 RepID=A0AAJ0HKS4_9PEZI|nr:hypothetical protein B0T25DRAFT_138358 [Lasiosphaeria hispida]